MPVTAERSTAPADATTLRRQELSDFLRSRRERISPEQVGLPEGGRRRTPGLRREEVAQLAGVGITWYTWLEQGRDINVSEQVLEAISRVLMLDGHERSHLFTLAGAALSDIETETSGLPDQIQLVLDGLTPYPASVTNGRYDVLAYNSSYTALYGDLAALPFDQRNTLWLAFTSKVVRDALVDWDEGTRRMVGQYRAAMAEHLGEPQWKCLINRLHEVSPEFAERWQRHDVMAPENCLKRYLHPELGLLRVNFTSFWLTPRMPLRAIVYTPADAETAEKLPLLATVTPRPLY
ncbi:MAG TPA: helix-turn-helix transcriptional regulator [Mycobacteriales bacterium]|jgi:transcriptional regulator with XRE-family HTH domain|nr:helix-turn-helix transcriptional regulator [Mycobacteriales bacterium]